MTDARTAILARIAAANRRNAGDAVPGEVAERLRHPPTGPLLTWTDSDEARFLERLQAASASVHRVADLASAAAAVRAYMDQERLQAPAVLAPHELLAQLQLTDGRQRPLEAGDRLAITVAFAGVAETGSLALLSGPDTPTRLNFLPEHLVCLLAARHILANLEALWRRIRQEHGALPRAVNLITGPSRTADVEQTIQLGAHGPRSLHVVLLEGGL